MRYERMINTTTTTSTAAESNQSHYSVLAGVGADLGLDREGEDEALAEGHTVEAGLEAGLGVGLEADGGLEDLDQGVLDLGGPEVDLIAEVDGVILEAEVEVEAEKSKEKNGVILEAEVGEGEDLTPGAEDRILDLILGRNFVG